MKANRKAIYNNEEAVSPVIAVILMVAITVVLAATVFVLVNELGQDVGSTGPTLGLTTQNSATDSDQWTITVTGATRDASIGDYTFILTVDGVSESSRWRTDHTATFADGGKPGAAATDAADGAYWEFGTGNERVCYQLSHTDIADDKRLGVGDRLVLRYSHFIGGGSPAPAECGGAEASEDSDFDDDMSGRIELELLHRPSSSNAGSIDRAF